MQRYFASILATIFSVTGKLTLESAVILGPPDFPGL